MKVKSLNHDSVRPLLMPVSASGVADGKELGQEEATRSDEAAEKEKDEVEEEEAAAVNPRVARRPAAPTKAMVLAHELHHADYRDWCEHCVAGKGVTHQHKQVEREHDTAEFSIDYGFMKE